jgi:spore maturation protein CgeB
MNIAFFGSSLISAYWNGAATYYRGILRALADRGHRITFYESDAFERQKHRDIPDPHWARVVVYSAQGRHEVQRCLNEASRADLIVKASGNGIFDDLLEAAVITLKKPRNIVAFWDVDAPATLDRVQKNPTDPFASLIPQYDVIFTYGGGDPVISAYRALGARQCVPIYNALDPDTHHPVAAEPKFAADLSFLGNRLPDREARVEEFFLKPAELLPQRKFLLGGSGWQDKPLPPNVNYLGHVYTRDHNALNCTPLAVLNVNRDSMAKYGFSPATRVFEAAGAGGCMITDAFEGIEFFYEPDKEILVATTGDQVAAILQQLTPQRAKSIGAAALRRTLSEHTYAHRAATVDEILAADPAPSGAQESSPGRKPGVTERKKTSPVGA